MWYFVEIVDWLAELTIGRSSAVVQPMGGGHHLTYNPTQHVYVYYWSLHICTGRLAASLIITTRKLSCRKDERAMHPIYGCPENFRESLTTFPEIFHRVLFRSILWMCIQNLKFIALSIPETMGCTQKNLAVPGYTHVPFAPKFFMGFYSDGPRECSCEIWSL